VADPPTNRGLVSAGASPATWLAGHGTVAAAVGGAPAPADARVAVGASVEGRAGPRALVAPRDVALLSVTAPSAGWAAGEVSLEPDELRADDRRAFAVRVVTPATVSADPGETGPFLAAALGALARAGQIHPGTAGAVRLGPAAAEAGGAAVVFPPADPVALGTANRSLAAAGVPWRFGPRVEREDTLAAPRLPEIAGARVARRYRLEASSGVEARGVLARVAGDPWLVRSGRTIVLGSRLTPDETSLPLASGFVPFVAALVNRLARGDEGIVEAVPGQVVLLPENVTALALGGGAVRQVAGAPAVTAPVEPGVYYLLAAGDTAGALVVATDPRESDLRRAAASDLARSFPGARVTVASSPQAYAAERFRGSGRRELTGWLLAAAVLVLIGEALVAAGTLERSA
jgi:hypothetical protein